MDKSYMMGVDISPIGTFNHWSPLADYTTTELAKLSDQLPLPTGVEIQTEVNNDWGESATLLAALTDPDETLTKADRLKAYISLLNYAKLHNNVIYINFLLSGNRIVSEIIKDLNRHNTHKLTAEESRNVIQHLIMLTSLDERNMKSSYSPIDDAMDLFKRVLKKLDDPTSLSRNLDDGMLTIARILFNNSVGKDDVGVMANGLKAFFALTQYFNKYRHDPDFQKRCGFFKKLSVNGKTIDFCTISDILLELEAIQSLLNGLRELGAISSEDEVRFANDDAGLLISSLISLATDNAKELALAKMNASIDLACMHLYLAVLGCNASEIVEFATTPEFKELTKAVNRSVLSAEGSSANSIIKRWAENGFTPVTDFAIGLTSSKADSSTNLSVSEMITSGAKTAFTVIEDSNAWNSVATLHEGDWIAINTRNGDNAITNYVKISKVTKLAQAENFTIENWCAKEGFTDKCFNRSIKPKFNKAWLFEFEMACSPYEYENLLTIYTVWRGALEMTKLARLAAVNLGVKVDILESTKFIDNFELILPDALTSQDIEIGDLALNYQTLYNQMVRFGLVVNDTILPIDSMRYFGDSDYRQCCVDVYNICKETFNVLDVINSLPHFYKMLEAFVVSQETLKQISSRSRTVLNDTQKAYQSHKISNVVKETYYDEYTDRDVTTFKRPFKILPFSEKIYSKANRYYDDLIVSEWLQENGERYEIDYVNIDDLTIQIVPTTNEGVREFCNFMAYTVIPELQATYTKNGFLQHIVPNFKKLKNNITLWLPSYKFNFDIDSLLTIQDENKAFYVQKGFAELANVTLADLDLTITEGLNIPVTELLYLYNKLTSFTGYGLNTLDVAFDGYLDQLFSQNVPTIAQSFSELILQHDTGTRDDIRIDPVKFLAFCYANEIRRYQKGIMHYDYDRNTKEDLLYNISDVYLFGLDERPNEVALWRERNHVTGTNYIQVNENNSAIDYNLLTKNLTTLLVESDENTYKIISTNDSSIQPFVFTSDAEINTIQDVLSAAYKVDPDGLREFLRAINTTDIKARPLKNHLSVLVYKTFATWMQERFGIPVELVSEDKNVHGRVESGKIYLNLNSDITTTPMHELMHIVFEFMKQEDFRTFENVVTRLTSSEEALQITQLLLLDSEYNTLMNLDLLAEVSCRMLEKMETGKTKVSLSTDLSETIMQNIAEMLGLSTEGRSLDLLSFLKDTISNLPSYNSLLLASLKPDRSAGYTQRMSNILNGMLVSNIIKIAISQEKLKETEC